MDEVGQNMEHERKMGYMDNFLTSNLWRKNYAKIVSKKPCLGEGTLAKVYKCWIEGAPNMLSNVQYVCKEPKVDYEATMTLQNNENINLNIDHSKVIKIKGCYTPILNIVKKPFSLMHYWN
jgi:hypothetical protein